VPHLERLLREEEAATGRKKQACGCEFKQLARGDVCADCLRGIIQQLRAGVGANSNEYFATEAPVPDGERVKGCPAMKRNLNNND
jgi:hypothetical protein